MEPDTKVRDRIAQPSHIATKQQHQPGSKNKQIHKKNSSCFKFRFRFCVRWHPSYHMKEMAAGQTCLKALKMVNIRVNHGGTNL